MEDKQFQELLMAVHKKDMWDLRMERVKKILNELLTGEFRDEIQGRKIIVRIEKLKRNVNAHIFRWTNPVIIDLNSERWERQPELNDSALKETLRHELLHIVLNAGDENPLFKLEAKRRKIKINLPIQN